MRILIDATTADPSTRVFGMSLVERLLHSLRRSPLDAEEIRILVDTRTRAEPGTESVDPAHPIRSAIRPRTLEDPKISWQGGADPLGERVACAQRENPTAAWLVLSGDTIVDARLFPQLAALDGNVFFTPGEGAERGAILLLAPRGDGEAVREEASVTNILELTERMAASGRARAITPEEFDPYIVELRRDLDPYLFRVSSEEARRRVERFMFWSNYKGSTDFMTKYVWPPLVWLLVRPLAKWRVHPNWVTAVDIAATFIAIPFWMHGWWATGFFLAYLMSLLDSVDGKLARVTYTYSRLGEVLDHGLDFVHPPFWYLGWAWGLSGGDTRSAVFQASVWMFWLYWADRVFPPIFKWRTGRSIHGYLPVDVKIRTFISRRNVNLPFFTAAVAIDALRPGSGWELSIAVFYAMVVWQAVCVVYHGVRTVQFFNVEKGSAPT
jgi:phosphatidylglycerophosphate synthase